MLGLVLIQWHPIMLFTQTKQTFIHFFHETVPITDTILILNLARPNPKLE